MLLSVFVPFSAYAQTESGKCGKNATYELKDGILTIQGTGAITSCPWRPSIEAEDNRVKKIIIVEGITGVKGINPFIRETELKEVQMPSTMTDTLPTFYDCQKLEKANLPEGIKAVSENAFRNCKSLKEIIIPDSVKKIERYAFYGCKSLEKADLPSNLEFVGNRAFYDCSSLKQIELPDKLTDIYAYAFAGCSSAEGRLTIPDSVNLYGYVFKDCKSITELYFKGEAGSLIRTGVFANCTGVKKIYVAKTMSVLNHFNFDGCTKLSTVEIGENIKSINSLYNIKSLKTVTLPKSANRIENSAFNGCSKLSSLKIQSKIDYVGENAFLNCPNVVLKFPNGVDEIGEHAIGYTQSDKEFKKIKNCKIYGKKCKALTDYCKENGFTFIDMYDVSNATAEMKSQTYNGSAKKPSVTVKLAGTTLKKDTDYTVKYSNNTKVGTAKVTITGKGTYKGTLEKTFKINPKPTELTKLTAGSKSFKAYWKKVTTQTTGYQIQYSTYKNLNNAKTVTITSYKTGAKTIKNLKAKKNYFVRIRAYKTVNGIKYYSKWSEVLSVKTK